MLDSSSVDIEPLSELEPLAKKCPRCGAPSANPNNPSGRCKACLKELAENKKKVGHWQRAQTKFDDAKRREEGKNGTAKKKHKDKVGSRKEFVKRFQEAERKAGEKLSPDRIDNDGGYASRNVRMVPERLNRGRHTVDKNKLKEWRKRMKKSGIDYDELYTLLKSKAYETGDESLLNLVKSLSPESLEIYIRLVEDKYSS